MSAPRPVMPGSTWPCTAQVAIAARSTAWWRRDIRSPPKPACGFSRPAGTQLTLDCAVNGTFPGSGAFDVGAVKEHTKSSRLVCLQICKGLER
jgi:hypothetical protein